MDITVNNSHTKRQTAQVADESHPSTKVPDIFQ